MDTPGPSEKKKSDSDQLRRATVSDYVYAHSKPNGNGWKGFFHSNLFVALALWFLSQALLVGGFIVSTYLKNSQITEWKGSIDATLKRMDDQGTLRSHYNDEREDRELTELRVRVDRIDENTRHIEVLESEHRRLTKDVEDLRNGKK